MEDVTTPVISGIVVLLAGLVAFFVVIGEGPEIAAPTAAGNGAEASTFSDLDPAVERVLLGTGEAWIYPAEPGPGIPAELARVLDAYQAALMIPVGEGQ